MIGSPSAPEAATFSVSGFTIIVSSGLLAKPSQIASIFVGVLIITAGNWALNRLMGIPAQVWAAPR
jgi:hypothetical protein